MTEDWEGGTRPGLRWWRLILLFAVVCVAALWWTQRDAGLTVERDQEPIGGPTAAPEVVISRPRKAGDRWYCPSDTPVRAYTADGVYYPAHYPRVAGGVPKPDECFADEERAVAAGYRLADPPPDSVVAGGVYVIPSAIPTLEDCARLATESGVAVPCPTRLPSPAVGPPCDNTRCRLHGGVVLEQRTFDAPRAFCPDCDRSARHVMITAVKGNRSQHLVTCPPWPAVGEDFGSVTPVPDDVVGLDYVGETPEILRCGEGPPWIPGIGGVPHEGHTMARWRSGPYTFAVSVDGEGDAQSELLDALLDGIEVCVPQGTQTITCRPLRP